MGDVVYRFPAPGPEPITADLDGWKKVFAFFATHLKT